MSDEIDVESARLEYLMAQKMKRIEGILIENNDLDSKPKHVQVRQIVPRNIFDGAFTKLKENTFDGTLAKKIKKE